MKRLTERDGFGSTYIVSLSDTMPELYAVLSISETNSITEVLNRLAAYEDAMPLERAQELARAEKDGRLVVLPCKVGDTVWAESPVKGMGYSFEAPDIAWIIESADQFGKEIFLTREEAEEALKKREEEDNE